MVKSGRKNILLTGIPGVGKTTLLMRIWGSLEHLRPVGFYTEEIREGGVRKGFALTDLDGRTGLLSHVDIKGSHRVGKYGVDVDGFENFIRTIPFLSGEKGPIIIDEIGKMECLSGRFGELLEALLDSEKTVIATISLRGSGLIEAIKRRSDITLIQVTHRNRDSLVSEVLEMLS